MDTLEAIVFFSPTDVELPLTARPRLVARGNQIIWTENNDGTVRGYDLNGREEVSIQVPGGEVLDLLAYAGRTVYMEIPTENLFTYVDTKGPDDVDAAAFPTTILCWENLKPGMVKQAHDRPTRTLHLPLQAGGALQEAEWLPQRRAIPEFGFPWYLKEGSSPEMLNPDFTFGLPVNSDHAERALRRALDGFYRVLPEKDKATAMPVRAERVRYDPERGWQDSPVQVFFAECRAPWAVDGCSYLIADHVAVLPRATPDLGPPQGPFVTTYTARSIKISLS